MCYRCLSLHIFSEVQKLVVCYKQFRKEVSTCLHIYLYIIFDNTLLWMHVFRVQNLRHKNQFWNPGLGSFVDLNIFVNNIILLSFSNVFFESLKSKSTQMLWPQKGNFFNFGLWQLRIVYFLFKWRTFLYFISYSLSLTNARFYVPGRNYAVVDW